MDTLYQVRFQAPVPPRQLQPQVPADLEAICLQCLQKDPLRRYTSADALAEDLKRFQAGQRVLAGRTGVEEWLMRWVRSLGQRAFLAGPTEAWAELRDTAARPGLVASLWLTCLIGLGVLVGLAGWSLSGNRQWAHSTVPTQSAVKAVAFAFDGKMLAAAEEDGTILLWDTIAEKRKGILKGPKQTPITALAFSRDGKTLAGASGAGAVIRWQVAQRKEIETLKADPGALFTSVAFAPDGQVVAVAAGGHQGVDATSHQVTVARWDLAKGNHLVTVRLGNREPATQAALSPDTATVATAHADGTIAFWDAATGKELAPVQARLTSVQSLVFSQDSKWIAAGNANGTVALWAAPGGEIISTFPGQESAVTALAFAPEGTLLGAGHADGKMEVWKIPNVQLWFSFSGHVAPITSLAFALDGKTLVSGSKDKRIKVWQVPANGGTR